jgi:predicted transcriptional regulator of viral defense system
MRKKETSHPLSRLFKQTLFTSKEAKALGIHPSLLAYYAKQGFIKRISRGVYRVEADHLSQDFQWTDLVEAVYGINEGVICLISALAIYGLTEEIPRQHWIGVRHGTDVVSQPQLKIVRFRNLTLGKTTIKLDGIIVPIFDRERTIVDAFRLLSKETAIKALRMALTQSGQQRLDLIKLQEYAKKLRVNIDPYLMTVTI